MHRVKMALKWRLVLLTSTTLLRFFKMSLYWALMASLMAVVVVLGWCPPVS
jgi:hypothetical protein